MRRPAPRPPGSRGSTASSPSSARARPSSGSMTGGAQDGRPPGATAATSAAARRPPRRPAPPGHVDEQRRGARAAYRSGRGDVGRRHGQHPGRHLDHLGRGPVAHGQLDQRGGRGGAQVGGHVVPAPAGPTGPVAWAMSPTTVIEPESDRRASMRSCIGERSCTSSTTMWPKDADRPPRRRRPGRGRVGGRAPTASTRPPARAPSVRSRPRPGAVRPGAPRSEHGAGLVDQRGVGGRPPHLVEGGTAGPLQHGLRPR